MYYIALTELTIVVELCSDGRTLKEALRGGKRVISMIDYKKIYA